MRADLSWFPRAGSHPAAPLTLSSQASSSASMCAKHPHVVPASGISLVNPSSRRLPRLNLVSPDHTFDLHPR